MSHTRPKWPRSSIRILGMIREYIDYGDKHVSRRRGEPGPAGPTGPQGPAGPAVPLPPRGTPSTLELIDPVTGSATVTANPDGSASLDGHLTYVSPGVRAGGDPIPFLVLPPGQGPDRSMRFPGIAWFQDQKTYLSIAIDLNPNGPTGSDAFLMTPPLTAGDTISFSVDHVTYWPPPAT